MKISIVFQTLIRKIMQDGPKTAGLPGGLIWTQPGNNPFGSTEIWNGGNQLSGPSPAIGPWSLTETGTIRPMPLLSPSASTSWELDTRTGILILPMVIIVLMHLRNTRETDTSLISIVHRANGIYSSLSLILI